MTEEDERLIATAARNNADWCDAFCDLHGIRGEFRHDAWASIARTPRYYPDAVTLVRSVDPAELLVRVDSSSGCSVKDSYADLNLTPWGFEVLFDASWIHRGSGSRLDATGRLSWKPVREDAGLAAWEAAWGGDPKAPRAFLPGLLARDDVVILAAHKSDDVVAGAILNSAADVIGLSNVFAVDLDPAEAFASAATEARRLWPGQELVGYQAGTLLDAAIRAGFEPLGPLVVWLKP